MNLRLHTGLFAAFLSFFSATAIASVQPRNGSIGVAHIVDWYERHGCGGASTLIIVTTDEDFETLVSGEPSGSLPPRLIEVVGTRVRVSAERLNADHWISGHEATTGRPIFIVPQRRAKDWI